MSCDAVKGYRLEALLFAFDTYSHCFVSFRFVNQNPNVFRVMYNKISLWLKTNLTLKIFTSIVCKRDPVVTDKGTFMRILAVRSFNLRSVHLRKRLIKLCLMHQLICIWSSWAAVTFKDITIKQLSAQ